MPSYVTPGLYFETVDTAPSQSDSSRVDIAAFIGIANQGPLHQPTRITSMAQFQAIFGGFIATSYLAYTVKAFFENGGVYCYIVRIATREAASATVELLDETHQSALHITASSPGAWGNDLSIFLTHASTFATQTKLSREYSDKRDVSLVESVVGFPVGSLVKVFQQQESKPIVTYNIVTASSPERNVLTWKTPLSDIYNLQEPLSLETVEFSLTVSRTGQIRELFPGLSLVPQHERYIQRIINEASSQLIRVDECVIERLIRVEISQGTGDAEYLANPDKFAQYIPDPTLLVRSLPDPTLLKNGSVKLNGGRDGLAELQPEDLIGDPLSEVKRGLRTLEDLRDVAIVAMPDLIVPPMSVRALGNGFQTTSEQVEQQNTVPTQKRGVTLLDAPVGKSLMQQTHEQAPRFSLEQVFQVQQAMIEHCEAQQRCIALLDPPSDELGRVLGIGEIQSWRRRFDSSYAALYYPQLLVRDPLHVGGQVLRAIPPCGHVAGMCARIDAEAGGAYRAPANEELHWVQAVDIDVTVPEHGMLNSLSINCIRAFPGRGVRIYGARTISSNPSWRYVNVRRLFIMLKRAIEAATQWAAFEPHGFELRSTLVLTITTLLESLWQQGALVGSKPSDAFFVKCDDKNNPPDAVEEGRLLVEVGVAPSMPAEFVIFRIGRTLDTLEITEEGV